MKERAAMKMLIMIIMTKIRMIVITDDDDNYDRRNLHLNIFNKLFIRMTEEN